MKLNFSEIIFERTATELYVVKYRDHIQRQGIYILLSTWKNCACENHDSTLREIHPLHKLLVYKVRGQFLASVNLPLEIKLLYQSTGDWLSTRNDLNVVNTKRSLIPAGDQTPDRAAKILLTNYICTTSICFIMAKNILFVNDNNVLFLI